MTQQLQNANLYAHYKANLWNTCFTEPDLHTLSTKIKIDKSARNTFWTVGWYFKDSGSGGYFGIQTRGDPNKYYLLGSIWNALGGKAQNGSYLVNFGGEGKGYSLRKDEIPIDLNTDYTLKLKRTNVSSDKITWTFFFNGVSLGEIYTPIAFKSLKSTGLYNFSEYYGNDISDCNSIPQSIVTWSFPKFNTMISSSYEGSSKGSCASNSYVEAANGLTKLFFGSNF